MKIIKSVFILVLLSCTTISAQLSVVSPEDVGLSSVRLRNADEVIETAIAAKEMPGAVLAVVKDGKMAYLKAYGNKEVYPNSVKMETNTVFDLASVTKPIATATSVMILVEQGKLRFLDKVNYFIPDFLGWKKADGKTIDIRIIDLLTHTSGLPSYVEPETLRKQVGAPNPDALIKHIAACKRDFEPQTNMQYSCLNYITLQRVVEIISKKSLQVFAKENIFNVLGMKHTDFNPKGETMLLTAPTQKQADNSVLRGVVHDPLARIMNGGVSGNAGLFSDASDLAVYVAALQNGGEWNGKRILSPLSVKTMRTVPRHVSQFGRTPGWDNYSTYSSNIGDLLGTNTYGHTGYTGTSIVIDPDNNLAVILLTNKVHPYDTGDVVRLRSLVANAVAGSLLKLPNSSFIVTLPQPWTYDMHFAKRIKQFAEEDPIGSSDIVMLGNSITEGGNWNKLLGIENVCNRGISGDITSGILKRLEITVKGNPKKLFLLIGINDLANNVSSDSIMKNLTKITDEIKRISPKTEIYLQSILPVNESFGRFTRVNGKTTEIIRVNKAISELAKSKKLHFINLYPLFTQPGTNILRVDLTYDGLHLSEAGYRVWAEELKKWL